MEAINRPLPLKADGFTIKDADGQSLGSTSNETLTMALVDAFNFVNRVPWKCDACGCLTVRVGNAYRCINCGNAMNAEGGR